MATPNRQQGEDRHRLNLSSRRSPPHEDRNSDISVQDERRDLRSAYLRSTQSDLASSPSSSSSSSNPLSLEGFDVDLFVDREQKYICPICMMVLREAQQTECGHRFCDLCIRRWIREKCHPRCPACNDPCTEGQLFPDNFAKREVMSLSVRCSNCKAGCNTVIELRHLEKHKNECPFSSVSCPNGCGEVLLRGKVHEHLQQFCTHRIVICEHCLQHTQFDHIMDHDEECPKKVIGCKYCVIRCRRSEMVGHVQKVCSNAPMDCYYNRFGCQHKFRRSQNEAHMQEGVVTHLFLVSQHLELTAHGTTKLYDVAHSSPSTLPNTTAPLTLGSSTDPGFCSDYSGTSTVYSTAPGRNPILHAIEEGSTDLMSPIYPIIPGHGMHPISAPSSPYGSHHGLMTGDQSRPLTFPLMVEKEKRANKERESTISKLQDAMQNQKQLIDLQTNRIRQLELQQRDFEGRMCNGIYIWKITEYNRKKHEAVEMKAVVHHSPGFYTSFYGYKMCIRINLNGVESGIGTHLSLFVHLMKGEYDEVLCWPFHGRIMLSVLDQHNIGDNKRDITETLIAKPGLAAFLKPTQKRNHKGFGYIEFAPLSYVENGDYIHHDTMIVKAMVKPDD